MTKLLNCGILRLGKKYALSLDHLGYIQSVKFSPDGKTLASSSCDNSIKIWDFKNRKEIRTLSGHSHCVRAITFNTNTQTLISGSDDHKIKVWDLYTGSLMFTLSGHSGSPYGVLDVAISPDGQIIASGSGSDKTIKIWHLESEKLLCTLSGHSRGITSVTFLDEQTLISGSFDKTIKIWRCN